MADDPGTQAWHRPQLRPTGSKLAGRDRLQPSKQVLHGRLRRRRRGLSSSARHGEPPDARILREPERIPTIHLRHPDGRYGHAAASQRPCAHHRHRPRWLPSPAAGIDDIVDLDRDLRRERSQRSVATAAISPPASWPLVLTICPAALPPAVWPSCAAAEAAAAARHGSRLQRGWVPRQARQSRPAVRSVWPATATAAHRRPASCCRCLPVTCWTRIGGVVAALGATSPPLSVTAA